MARLLSKPDFARKEAESILLILSFLVKLSQVNIVVDKPCPLFNPVLAILTYHIAAVELFLLFITGMKGQVILESELPLHYGSLDASLSQTLNACFNQCQHQIDSDVDAGNEDKDPAS